MITEYARFNVLNNAAAGFVSRETQSVVQGPRAGLGSGDW